MLSRYFKLVVGYFVYNAARTTAVTIHDFLIYLNEEEAEELPPFEYDEGSIYG